MRNSFGIHPLSVESDSFSLFVPFDSRLSSLGLYKLDANSPKGYVPGIATLYELREESSYDSKATVIHFAGRKRFRDLLFIGKSAWRGSKVNLSRRACKSGFCWL